MREILPPWPFIYFQRALDYCDNISTVPLAGPPRALHAVTDRVEQRPILITTMYHRLPPYTYRRAISIEH